MSKKKCNRNDPCSCGSGKKYKQCCLLKESSVAKYTPLGKMKFSATVLRKDASDYVKIFEKYSKKGKEEAEKKIRNFSITKEKLSKMSKKQLKQWEQEEEKKSVEKLHNYSFQTLSMEKEQDFIPTQEDFRISPEQDNFPRQDSKEQDKEI